MRMTTTRRRGVSEDAPRKKPTNVSIDEALLTAARANNINLSQTLEDALRDKLRKIEQQRWLEENREAIEEYNRYVEKYGVFSDGRRRF
jgi:antitoxin CcdA